MTEYNENETEGYFGRHYIETMATLAVVVVTVLTFLGDYNLLGLSFIVAIICAHISGMIGEKRRIGFQSAFWIGFLVPIIGVIIALASPQVDPYADIRVAEEIAPAMPDTLDKLSKLQELREKGALTEDEFSIQKNKILNS